MMLELAYVLLLIVAVVCFTVFQIISIHLEKVNKEIKSLKKVLMEQGRIDLHILNKSVGKEKRDDDRRDEDSRDKGEQAPTEAQGS